MHSSWLGKGIWDMWWGLDAPKPWLKEKKSKKTIEVIQTIKIKKDIDPNRNLIKKDHLIHNPFSNVNGKAFKLDFLRTFIYWSCSGKLNATLFKSLKYKITNVQLK